MGSKVVMGSVVVLANVKATSAVQPEHRASTACALNRCCAVQVACGILDHAPNGSCSIGTVGSRAEAIKDRLMTCAVQLEYRTIAARAADEGRAVEIASSVPDHTRRGRFAVSTAWSRAKVI